MLIQCKTQEGYDFLCGTYFFNSAALPNLRMLIDELHIHPETRDEFERLDGQALKACRIEPFWAVCVKDDRRHGAYEISVVRTDNEHGFWSYGWHDSRKLHVCDSGGPCKTSIKGFVWDCQIAIAHELCRRLNAGEGVDALGPSNLFALPSPSEPKPPEPRVTREWPSQE